MIDNLPNLDIQDIQIQVQAELLFVIIVICLLSSIIFLYFIAKKSEKHFVKTAFL
jgi:hypothetical protein